MGHSASVIENMQLVRQMCGPLMRFDASDIAADAGGNSAAAVAGSSDSRHIHKQDGLLVALWGQARFREPRLIQLALADGMAKTLGHDWRERGEKALEGLAGAFSLCIIDEVAHEAFLAIDRMGVNPLTYQVYDGGLVFGSSADAINIHTRAKSEISPQSLYNYVYFHMVPGPDTIYQGQKRLLPGEYLFYRKGHAETRKYWQMQFLENEKRPFQELKNDFLSVLRSSVRDAVGDHQAGAFLSGGTDSSTIAGILGEVCGAPARTYSIGFDASGYDEMEYARIAARHFSTRHHEYYVTPDDIVSTIPQVAAIFDQPFGNASAIPAFYCARMAKADGVTRMLGGDGGDELFGGNARYAKQHLFSLYEKTPVLVRKGILEPLVFGLPGGERIAVGTEGAELHRAGVDTDAGAYGNL